MSNPLISKAKLSTTGAPLTVEGVIFKSFVLLAICAATALGVFAYGLMTNLSQTMFGMIMMVGFFPGLIIAVATCFKPQLANVLAIPYSLFEGLFLGGLCGVAYFIAPSIPGTALGATFITAIGMLTLYRTGVIKVTQKFRSVITSATIAIMILYVVQLVLSLAFSSSIPSLFDGGMLAIGFSLFVIVIASFNLLLDFDNIETAAKQGVSDDMEWLLSMGLLMTLVWMFVEFTRLLGYLED